MSFDGFPPDALGFFDRLAANNDRDWFQAHKDEYEQLLKTPMIALVADLASRLAGRGVPLTVAEPAKSIMRINRDVRFSKDKRPYKTNIAATLTRTGERHSPGALYLHVSPAESFATCDHIESRLLAPERLEALMDQLLERRDEWVGQRRLHVADLERRATEAEAKLNRVFEAIENGVIDAGDSSLKSRIAELTATRDQARSDADRAVAHIEKIGPAITTVSLRGFAIAARKKLRKGDGSFARDHVRAVAQRVDVVSRNEVRIRGLRSELLRTLTAASGVEAAVLGVRSFESKWRARRDSNS